jgi:phosphatidylinositol glycan class Z
LCAILLSGVLTTIVAVATDTAFYHGSESTKSFAALFSALRHSPVITPLNNLLYNSQTSNLAEHGLHPHYQHFLVNLPQLLGPAMILLLTLGYPMTTAKLTAMSSNSRLTAAATGTLILSLIPHQEPRFLLPCIPLLLTCVHLPSTADWRRYFWISWIIFNATLGILMGVYHQGGIMPAQLALPSLFQHTNPSASHIDVFWWKTYPPPTYLLGTYGDSGSGSNSALSITSVASMGMPQSELLQTISLALEEHGVPCSGPSLIPSFLHAPKEYYIAAPLSAWRSGKPFDRTDLSFVTDWPALNLTHLATFPKHVNLDDMDFGEEGVYNTLARVLGRRGLGVWRVERSCPP